MSRPNFELKQAIKALSIPRKNGIFSQDINDLLIGVQALYDSYGWENYGDTLYTSGNKRSLTANQEAFLTINGGVVINSQAPTIEGHLPFWDSSNNLIKSTNVGDTFGVRLSFSASIAANDAYLAYEVRIGPGFTVPVYRDIVLFPKGANVDHFYSEFIKIYSLETFVESGARIFLIPSHATLFWGASIFIEKNYSGR